MTKTKEKRHVGPRSARSLRTALLSGVKRTLRGRASMSAYDPKRTLGIQPGPCELARRDMSAARGSRRGTISYDPWLHAS